MKNQRTERLTRGNVSLEVNAGAGLEPVHAYGGKIRTVHSEFSMKPYLFNGAYCVSF